MTSPLDPAALELYEAPFRYDEFEGYVVDSNNRNFVLVTNNDKPVADHIAAALTEYWERNKS